MGLLLMAEMDNISDLRATASRITAVSGQSSQASSLWPVVKVEIIA